MVDDFQEKYRPKLPSDILGNKTQIIEIKSWIENFNKNREIFLKDPKKKKKTKTVKIDEVDESVRSLEIEGEKENNKNSKNLSQHNQTPYSCLLVTGENGVGKTCTTLAVLNQLKYVVQTIDLSKLGSNKSVLEIVNKVVTGGNIYDQMNCIKNVKTAIVLDEIESINSPVEKNFILTLLKQNTENWHLPIIFISSGRHSKINTILKSGSNIVEFNQPVYSDLLQLLSIIATEEKMFFDSIEVGKKVVEQSQNDFRRLVAIAQDLKTTYGTSGKSISQSDLEQYCLLSKKKDTTIEIYKATAQMMVKYHSINECLRMYDGDKVIIPLVMHQNYIKCILKHHPAGDEIAETKFELVNDIAKSIAFGDLVENFIYSDQNWDMQEVHGFLTCVKPAFLLSCEKIRSNEEYLKRSFEYPYDLNRTSIKKINKKNIINSNSCLTNLEINDFIFANRLIRRLIQDDKIDECGKLFKGYGAKIENVESILKIDKINSTKTVIPTQIKKRMNQILTNNS